MSEAISRETCLSQYGNESSGHEELAVRKKTCILSTISKWFSDNYSKVRTLNIYRNDSV